MSAVHMSMRVPNRQNQTTPIRRAHLKGSGTAANQLYVNPEAKDQVAVATLRPGKCSRTGYARQLFRGVLREI